MFKSRIDDLVDVFEISGPNSLDLAAPSLQFESAASVANFGSRFTPRLWTWYLREIVWLTVDGWNRSPCVWSNASTQLYINVCIFFWKFAIDSWSSFGPGGGSKCFRHTNTRTKKTLRFGKCGIIIVSAGFSAHFWPRAEFLRATGPRAGHNGAR